jgi:trans-aconitate methyltransferase
MAFDAAERDRRQQFRAMAQGSQSLAVAFVGISNGLFGALHRLGNASAEALATAAARDRGYVRRWCDAAYAFGYLEAEGDTFRLSDTGAAMLPEAPQTLMPMAVQTVLNAHVAERAAALMASGERPGEQVLVERQTVAPWFGPMLEATHAAFFEQEVCPGVPIFREVDARGGLAVDLGCGNGWYLRALARRCHALRGLGLDGIDDNIAQAKRLAAAEGFGGRLRFDHGDLRDFTLAEPADLIAMNRALHHVWEAGGSAFLARLRHHLRPGGAVVIWEPDWPAERSTLRSPAYRHLAFQNLSEHVQGNHLLRAEEIVAAFTAVAMEPEVFHFRGGSEVFVVARRPA